MTEIVKETVISNGDNGKPIVNSPVITKATKSETWEYLVYFFFGALEVLLAFRLIFKLMGASLSSAFVTMIYGVTGIFILPFQGIFRQAYAGTASVLEPSVIVALIFYVILAWGIVKLVRISSGEQQEV